MSDQVPTPRTDAALQEIQVAFVGFDGTSSAPEKWIDPAFARELEREIAALTSGERVILPSSVEHAKAMYSVAAHYLSDKRA